MFARQARQMGYLPSNFGTKDSRVHLPKPTETLRVMCLFLQFFLKI